jgi:hypothetical protein
MKECVIVAVLSWLMSLTVSFKGVHSQVDQQTNPPYPRVIGQGAPRPGETIRLHLESPIDGGAPYLMATSLGTGPIPCGRRTIPLTLDAVFLLSVSGRLPQVFENYSGYLDVKGKALAAIHLPNHREIVGVRLHTAFMTMPSTSQLAVRSISPPFVFTVAR